MTKALRVRHPTPATVKPLRVSLVEPVAYPLSYSVVGTWTWPDDRNARFEAPCVHEQLDGTEEKARSCAIQDAKCDGLLLPGAVFESQKKPAEGNSALLHKCVSALAGFLQRRF